ncbi:MAG: PEP-CTERM sorting domain-containing protein [Cyanobacteria bacterium J06635_15]
MFGLSQKFAAVAAGSLVAVGAIGVNSAQAVTFFSFEVELTDVSGDTDPAIGDVFEGTFSFEETAGLVAGGIETFDLTAFEFDFLGSSFDLGSDSRVASLTGFPTVAFDVASGDILGLDFFTESFLPATNIDLLDNEFEFSTATGVSGSGLVSYSPIDDPGASVPEPATILGLIVIGAGSLVVRKQQA